MMKEMEMAKNCKSALLCLGLGQILSLSLTSTQFTNSLLQNKGIHAPFTLSFLSYLLLGLVYGGIMIYRGQRRKLRWIYYEILAFVDSLAYMSVVHAYERTTLTTVSLLDCWTIPCVLLLTCFFLKTKYRFQKMTGVLICVAGLATFVFFKLHSADRSSRINLLKYFYLIISGATLYGVSNVLQESFLKKIDRVEVMAFFGIHGASMVVIIMAIFERNEIKSIYYSPGAIFPIIGFSLAMFLFYSGVSLLLKINGSTMLNLSLLTSDMWAVLFRIFAHHEKVNWTYFLAFAAVTLGLIVYSGGDNMDPDNCETDCKHFDEEADLGHPNNAWDSNSKVKSTRIDEEGGITIKN